MIGKRNHTGHRVGQWHPNAKLTDDQVRSIRQMHATGTLTYRNLARAFKCGESTIRDIIKRWTRASA